MTVSSSSSSAHQSAGALVAAGTADIRIVPGSGATLSTVGASFRPAARPASRTRLQLARGIGPCPSSLRGAAA